MALGVFGVPTFVYDGELMFGQDRIDVLLDRLSGWKGGKDHEQSGNSVQSSGPSGDKDAGDSRAGRPTPPQEDEKQATTSSKATISSKL